MREEIPLANSCLLCGICTPGTVPALLSAEAEGWAASAFKSSATPVVLGCGAQACLIPFITESCSLCGLSWLWFTLAQVCLWGPEVPPSLLLPQVSRAS